MSNQLIQNAQQGVQFLSVWSVICLLVFVAFIATMVILYILLKKRGKCLKEKEQIKSDLYEQIEEYPIFVDEDNEENYKKRCELQKEVDEKVKVVEKKQGKLERLYNIFEPLGSKLAIGVLILFMLGLAVVNTIASSVSGDVSSIVPVDNVTSQEISVTAYYQIEYNDVQQKTLTVFVRNDSKKVLESANIIETESDSNETIEYLEPGQEKIVSIDIYQNNQEDFQFAIDNIKFIE